MRNGHYSHIDLLDLILELLFIFILLLSHIRISMFEARSCEILLARRAKFQNIAMIISPLDSIQSNYKTGIHMSHMYLLMITIVHKSM